MARWSATSIAAKNATITACTSECAAVIQIGRANAYASAPAIAVGRAAPNPRPRTTIAAQVLAVATAESRFMRHATLESGTRCVNAQPISVYSGKPVG